MMRRARLALIPVGPLTALVLLGMVFIVTYPLGRSWTWYAVALIWAAIVGFLYHRRLRVEILERYETETEKVWVTRQTASRSLWRRPPPASSPPPGLTLSAPEPGFVPPKSSRPPVSPPPVEPTQTPPSAREAEDDAPENPQLDVF